MSNLSSSQVQKIQSLYEGIYQKEEKELTQEEVCDILAIEIYNALVEEGLLEGEIITETTIKEGKFGQAWKAIKGVVGPVIKQVTGFGTKPTTALGTKVRQGQKLTTAAVTGASVVKPEVPQRIFNTATGAVTGAVKGGYEGATRPTGGGPIQAAQRALDAASGKAVPAVDDKKKNGNGGWSSVPSGK
jgi:hypothetical protein